MPRRYGHNKLVLKWLQNNLSQLRKILIFYEGRSLSCFCFNFFRYPSKHICGENDFDNKPWMVLKSMHGYLTDSFLLWKSRIHVFKDTHFRVSPLESVTIKILTCKVGAYECDGHSGYPAPHHCRRPSVVTSLLAAAAASRLLVSPLMVRPRVAALRRMIREHPRSLSSRHVSNNVSLNSEKDLKWSAKILKTACLNIFAGTLSGGDNGHL